MRASIRSSSLFLIVNSIYFLGITQPHAQDASGSNDSRDEIVYKSEKKLSATELKANSNILVSALVSAYNNNPELQTGLREYYAAVEAIPAARSAFLPKLSLSSQAQHQKSFSNGANTSNASFRARSKSANNTLGLNTTLQQNIYNGSQSTYALEQAEASVKAARLKFITIEQKVLLDAIKAYLDVWRTRETLRYRKASVGFSEQVVAQIKAQEEVGEKTRTDVAEAESRLAGAIADQMSAEADLVTAEATYAQVIGGDSIPPEIGRPCLLVAKSASPQSLEDLMEKSLSSSPSLQQALFAEKAQKAGVGIAEGTLKPTVDFTADAGRQRNQNQQDSAFHGGATSSSKGFSYSNSGTVGVKMSVPLFEGGASWSGIRKANQQRYQALNALQKARVDVKQTVQSTWQTLKSLEASVNQVERQVEAAILNLEGKRQEYIVGERTLTDTLDAEQKLVTAQVQLVSKQRDYQVVFYQLLSLYGNLLPETLSLPTERHDVNAYTDEMSGKILGTGDLRDIKTEGDDVSADTMAEPLAEEALPAPSTANTKMTTDDVKTENEPKA